MTTDKTPATLATVDASYTTGHCAHNNRPGGCHLHNLQCGWPACDRRPAKPSLATVKHGGCVQLADSERARFEAWAHAQSYRGGNIMADRDSVHPDVYADPIAQLTWKSWQAALSTQPSLAGQGDALECIGRIEEAIEFRVPHDIYAAVHGELADLKAALAARQPVGEPVAKSVGIDALVQLLVDEAEECAKGWVERGDAYASGKSAGLLEAADYFRKIATSQRWSEFLSSPAQAVDLGRDAAMFRNAMRLLTNFDVNRYLISCADGRQNGALKAHHHIALCTAFVAALTGEIHDSARMRHPELYEAIHSATQDALTDRMDEVIGFPLSGRPDYDTLAPKFFDVFFDAAMATLNDSQAVGNG